MDPQQYNEWLLALRTGDRPACEALYSECFPVVERMVRLRGGTRPDAEDAFQEAIMALCQRAADTSFRLTAPPSHFLISAARRQWLKRLRERERLSSQSLPDPADCQEPAHFPLAPLYAVLKRLTQHCFLLLSKAFLLPKKQQEKIAEELGYKNRHSFDNQKYKCLQQARKLVRKG